MKRGIRTINPLYAQDLLGFLLIVVRYFRSQVCSLERLAALKWHTKVCAEKAVRKVPG